MARAAADATDGVPAGGGLVYTPEDFARFSPKTALDMLVQTPGFVIRREDSERGLGEASGNVLLNGKRLSGKSDDILSQIGRIPAGDVVRIEIAPEELPLALEIEMAQRMAVAFKELGFKFVTLDLEGYRTGALNESLKK